MSVRGDEWRGFSQAVHDHIETYTVAQYGDAGEDLCSAYTVEDCLKQVQKYLKRQGRNQRAGQDLTDLVKMAHYTQMAFTKLAAASCAQDGRDE